MKKFKALSPAVTVTAAITLLYSFIALFALGSSKAPQSFFTATADDYMFTVNFEQPVNLGSIYTYSGLGNQFSQPQGQKLLGEFEISVSENGNDFYTVCDIKDLSVYTWNETVLNSETSTKKISCVRVRAKYVSNVLYEIAFFDTDGQLLQGKVNGSPNAISAFDEQNTVPNDTSYYNSMYFDEIYHARTAFEQLKGYDIYETTHPPLGKILISLGIAVFGMTPFGWRIVGVLCGIIMIPIMYMLVNAVCKKQWIGCLAAALLALDFMHLTQTRIATVDTYVVLFVMLTFMFMAFWHNSCWKSKKGWVYLALSGISMGCAVSSKWNGAYPMVGLAIVFFVSLALKFQKSKKEHSDKAFVVKTLLLCCIFFVAVPVLIYTATFTAVIDADGASDFLRQFVGYQKHMFNYHSTLVAEHFFASKWYTWPFSLKPMWYSIAEKGALASSISAFGNPAIWVLTPAAAIYCLILGIKNKSVSKLLVGLGWLSSYLPWVAVSRLCFIYHYFPCAVFGIAAICIAVCDLCRKKPAAKKAVFVYLALCAVLFCMFLPVTLGLWVPKEYLDFLEFLPNWHFINI